MGEDSRKKRFFQCSCQSKEGSIFLNIYIYIWRLILMQIFNIAEHRVCHVHIFLNTLGIYIETIVIYILVCHGTIYVKN